MPLTQNRRLLSLNNPPLVSILCPTYNAEAYIVATLDSLANQVYSNIEIIISDDCSTDSTVQIIRSYLKKNCKLNVSLNVNSTNLGITPNCNHALRLCNGKYIAFFAGDDLMYPDKVDRQVKLMESDDDCTISYHAVDILDGDHQNRILFTTEQQGQSYFSFLDIITKGGFVGVCSVMVRRDSVPSSGFSEALPKVSDWLMTIEVALRGKVLMLDGVHGAYLRHSKGASRETFETLWEIRETLNFLRDRYNGNYLICKSADTAYKRILLGEISRLVFSGDRERLLELRKLYLKGQPILSIVWLGGFLILILRVDKLKVFKYLYGLLSG